MDFGGIGGIFEELAFGMASFATLTTAAIYSKHKSTAHNIEAAPVLNVGNDLFKSLRQSTTIPYAVIVGRVHPNPPTLPLDTVSSMPAVISKHTTRELRWMDSYPPFLSSLTSFAAHSSPSLKFIPFILTNPNITSVSSPPLSSSVLVDDVTSATFDNLLVTTSATWTSSPPSVSDLILSYFRGFHSVGTEDKEQILPVGSVITAIGEVTKLSGGGSADTGARIGRTSAGGSTTPYILTTKNIMEIKSHFRAQAFMCKVLTVLFGGLTLMTFYALLRKWLPRWRMRRTQRVISRGRRQEGQLDGLSDGQICVTCLQNPREVALFPCGHVCVCADCSLRIDERCPVCREQVDETVGVYLA